MLRSRRSVAADLKTERRARAGAAAGGQGRRAAGGLPARRGRAAGGRPAGVPGGEPGAGLRADDRLGPGRADGRAGRPRHQLHLADRHAARDRGRRPARRAAQPARRLRRRLHVPGRRRAGRALGAAAVRCRAGGGHGHGGRDQRAGADGLGLPRRGRLDRRPRGQPARRGRPVLRHLHLRGRPVDRGGRTGAAVLRAVPGRAGDRRGGPAGADGPRRAGPGCGPGSPK